MVMPLFSVLGGLVVFAWSRRLYGTGGGLLSLCLWVFCPNVLAHCRLITTDLGSTALGVAATYRLLALPPESLLAAGRGGGGLARAGPADQVQHAPALCGLAVPLAGAADPGRRLEPGSCGSALGGRRPRLPDRRR